MSNCCDFVVIKSRDNVKVRKNHMCKLCKIGIKKGELAYMQTCRDNEFSFALINTYLHRDCFDEMMHNREECLECPLFNRDGTCSGECEDEVCY